MDGESAGARVRLTGLSKWYREGTRRHMVLEALDFEVEAGELVVVLGRSGSGKSTLLNLIGGLDLADAGRVFVDDVEIGSLSERDRTLFRRRRIGFVFQFFNLIPTLTVRENLLLPLELQGRQAEGDRVGALLEEVGLADRTDSFPDRLSGGEQQRVAIARALVADPGLILADEPTGNLDVDTGDRVLALMEALVGDRGRTLVMATHSREIARRADRVVRIRDGGLEPVRLGRGAPDG